MMSVNKMLIGGAAVFATVALIGCKDDDEDSSCDGVDATYTFDVANPSGNAAWDYASELASNEDCATCFSKEIGEALSLKIEAQSAAITECGGTFKFTSTACDGVAIGNEADLQALPPTEACGFCITFWSSDITLLSSATFDANSKAAYEACGGKDADWGESS